MGRQKTFNCVGIGEDILKRTYMAQEITSNTDRWDYLKIKIAQQREKSAE